jgi:hypothetical protein
LPRQLAERHTRARARRKKRARRSQSGSTAASGSTKTARRHEPSRGGCVPGGDDIVHYKFSQSLIESHRDAADEFARLPEEYPDLEPFSDRYRGRRLAEDMLMRPIRGEWACYAARVVGNTSLPANGSEPQQGLLYAGERDLNWNTFQLRRGQLGRGMKYQAE